MIEAQTLAPESKTPILDDVKKALVDFTSKTEAEPVVAMHPAFIVFLRAESVIARYKNKPHLTWTLARGWEIGKVPVSLDTNLSVSDGFVVRGQRSIFDAIANQNSN